MEGWVWDMGEWVWRWGIVGIEVVGGIGAIGLWFMWEGREDDARSWADMMVLVNRVPRQHVRLG